MQASVIRSGLTEMCRFLIHQQVHQAIRFTIGALTTQLQQPDQIPLQHLQTILTGLA